MYLRAALFVAAVIAAVAVAEPIPAAVKQLEKKQDDCTESSTSVNALPTYPRPSGPPYYGPVYESGSSSSVAGPAMASSSSLSLPAPYGTPIIPSGTSVSPVMSSNSSLSYPTSQTASIHTITYTGPLHTGTSYTGPIYPGASSSGNRTTVTLTSTSRVTVTINTTPSSSSTANPITGNHTSPSMPTGPGSYSFQYPTGTGSGQNSTTSSGTGIAGPTAPFSTSSMSRGQPPFPYQPYGPRPPYASSSGIMASPGSSVAGPIMASNSSSSYLPTGTGAFTSTTLVPYLPFPPFPYGGSSSLASPLTTSGSMVSLGTATPSAYTNASTYAFTNSGASRSGYPMSTGGTEVSPVATNATSSSSTMPTSSGIGPAPYPYAPIFSITGSGVSSSTSATFTLPPVGPPPIVTGTGSQNSSTNPIPGTSIASPTNSSASTSVEIACATGNHCTFIPTSYLPSGGSVTSGMVNATGTSSSGPSSASSEGSPVTATSSAPSSTMPLGFSTLSRPYSGGNTPYAMPTSGYRLPGSYGPPPGYQEHPHHGGWWSWFGSRDGAGEEW
ncbi:hypothetical protein KC343_g15730 [Hortaea werneckii]|nr:hypothetical protein KC352_g28638 [Hortaea werneckii]KAI7549520.1 hypothetical protein KC317_g14545 [Hortaea werneckii]KAI7598095.1 hypothetical protein KC346_g14380 [Hortaea werneckii]KAI7600237.1 hypothetical protein KC343_g15730 [Hortaea werneckii]KAI7635540.1 hypothetical protein KC319_g15445 [Hortaea werneckii]